MGLHNENSMLAVIRNKDGFIRANNFEKLNLRCQQEIRRLVALDGWITAESFPNKDSRFSQEGS